MTVRSPRTTRNLTNSPVQIGATEAVLAGLPGTQADITLPDIPSGEDRLARDFILDIMQDIQTTLAEVGVRNFRLYRSGLAPRGALSRVGLLSLKDQLMTAAQLSLEDYTAPARLVDEGENDLTMVQDANVLLRLATEGVLSAFQDGMWDTTADLLGDGILTFENEMLLWQESEVEVQL